MTISSRVGGKEVKFVAANPSWASIGASPARAPLLSTISSGSDMFGNRVGRRIRVTKVRFRGQLLGAQTNSVADDPYNTVRVTLIRCLPGTMFSSYTVDNALDLRFSTSAGLLEVLYDRTVVLNVNAKDSVGYIAAAKEWEFCVDCNVIIDYGGTGAAAPINQELVLYAVSDSGAVVNPGFAAATTWAVEYIDD